MRNLLFFFFFGNLNQRYKLLKKLSTYFSCEKSLSPSLFGQSYENYYCNATKKNNDTFPVFSDNWIFEILKSYKSAIFLWITYKHPFGREEYLILSTNIYFGLRFYSKWAHWKFSVSVYSWHCWPIVRQAA